MSAPVCSHERAVMRVVGLVGFLLCPCGVVSGPYPPEPADDRARGLAGISTHGMISTMVGPNPCTVSSPLYV